MASDSESLSESNDSINFEEIIKQCIWCNEAKKLENGKKYCHRCSQNMFRECTRCHKPFPHARFFKINEKRCNSCQQKFLAEKKKREEKSIIQESCLEEKSFTEKNPEVGEGISEAESTKTKISPKPTPPFRKKKILHGKVIKITKDLRSKKYKCYIPIVLNIEVEKN